MTTTRTLCGALSAILQVRGVERHAARLVRDGYLPRSGEEVDERDATILLLAVAAAPHPDQATEVVETLSSLNLRFLSQAVALVVTVQCGDDDRALMPGNVVDAVAEALEYEACTCTPGFQITRLSIQQGGQNATLDAHIHLPGEMRSYCAQYGDIDLFPSGLQTITVVSDTILRAVAAILQPDQAQRHQQELMPSLAIN